MFCKQYFHFIFKIFQSWPHSELTNELNICFLPSITSRAKRWCLLRLAGDLNYTIKVSKPKVDRSSSLVFDWRMDSKYILSILIIYPEHVYFGLTLVWLCNKSTVFTVRFNFCPSVSNIFELARSIRFLYWDSD